jgi:hypothetical protein
VRAYREGTLTLTANSDVLVGVGTAFSTNVSPGDLIICESNQCFEAVSVNDDTHIKVDVASKVSGSFKYVIVRFVQAVNFRDLTVKIEAFLSDRQTNMAEFTDWQTGTKTGGPNGNGFYPITDRYGTTRLFACPELLSFGYTDAQNQATAAKTSATAALASQTAAKTSETNAKTSETNANTSKTAAAGSATAAAGSATAAATSATNAAGSESTVNASKVAAANSATASATSAAASLASQTAAKTSETNSKTSETNSKTSETNAAASAAAALASKNAAGTSETNAAGSATAANTSKLAAATSATNASTSETNANASKVAAATSETNALASKTAAATSATNAATSETNANSSKVAAAGSATAAATSATQAATSKTNAGTSETNAAASAAAALASQTAAKTSETNSKTSETNAAASATAANTSKTAAATSATNAATSETNANTSKTAAAQSAADAAASAAAASSGNLGGTDKMPDNWVANPMLVASGSLPIINSAGHTLGYAVAADSAVPAGCPSARMATLTRTASGNAGYLVFPSVNADDWIPVAPGEKLDLSAYLTATGNATTGTTLSLFVGEYTATGATIQNTRVATYDNTKGGWQRVYGTVKASATTYRMRMMVVAESTFPTGGVIYIAEPNISKRKTLPIQDDFYDNTKNALLQVGAFGLGATDLADVASGSYNDMKATGFYLMGSACTDGPVAGSCKLITMTNANNYCQQIAMPQSQTRMFQRSSNNNVWTAWSESWSSSNLVKTTSNLDTTQGSVMKVGDFGIGNVAGIKIALASDADWGKPSGWSGFIDVGASKTNGCTVPTDQAGVNPSFGIWTITGRRDTLGGYTGLFVDYSNGRTWTGFCSSAANPPVFSEIISMNTGVTTFMRTVLDDTTAAAAQATLGIPALVAGMISGITSKALSNTNVTLTAAEAANGVLYLTGALGADVSVIVPAVSGRYTVYNLTTGNFGVTIRAGAVGNAGKTVAQGRSADLTVIGTGISYSNTGFDSILAAGEIASTSGNNFRIVSGNYGTFWRNDGGSLYLMLTNSGDQFGNYNAFRPFAVNLTTGKVNINNGLGITTLADGTNTADAASTAFVQNALAALGVGTAIGPLATDLNAETLGGFCRTTNTTLNIPLAGNLSVITAPYNAGGCMQMAVQLGGTSRMFWRTQAGGVWTAWKESAAAGANSDITSLAGLTTALSIAQGGTGATTQAGAQTALGLVPTSSGLDATTGRLLKVGDFGIGGPAQSTTNINQLLASGAYRITTGATGFPPDIGASAAGDLLEVQQWDANTQYQRYRCYSGTNVNREFWRIVTGGVFTGIWYEVFSNAWPDRNRASLNVMGRNRVMNGAFQVANRPTSAAIAGTANGYICDRWKFTNGGAGGTIAGSRNAAVGVNNVPTFWARTTCNAVVTNLGSAFYWAGPSHIIEQANCYELSSQPASLSFWFAASVGGKYYVSIRSGDNAFSYVAQFSYTATAGTPQKMEINLPALPFTISQGTGAGLSILFCGLNNGSLAVTAANLNKWVSGNYITGPAGTGISAWGSSAGAWVQVAYVQLEQGLAATTFERIDYSEEIRRCQRYYEEVPGTVATNQPRWNHRPYKVTKRASPTLYLTVGNTGGADYGPDSSGGVGSFRLPGNTLSTSDADFTMAADCDF